jgi:hypothetical protein
MGWRKPGSVGDAGGLFEWRQTNRAGVADIVGVAGVVV